MNSDLVYVLDIFGVAVFAISGAVKGVRLKLDFLGVVVFAVLVGTAGGVIRDCIIGQIPAALMDPLYLIISILMGVSMFFIAPIILKRWKIIIYCDVIGLAIVTAIGVQKAVGISPIGQVLVGVIGAVGGGIIRDVCSKEIPSILTSDFYATAAILGGLAYVILNYINITSEEFNFAICFFMVAILRLLAIRFNIRLPKAKYDES